MKQHHLTGRSLRLIICASILSVAATIPASAHVGVGSIQTFQAGFLHPLSGIDHILAMVAVGIFAANLGGRALWLVPSAFVGTMMVGGILGYYGWPLPLVEGVIGFSVVAMGCAILLGVRMPTVAAMALVGTFALFHGHAHGSEGAGLGVAFMHYAIGFIMATVILHVVGIICGLASAKRGPRMQKIFNNVAGTIGIVAGVSLLAGWLAA